MSAPNIEDDNALVEKVSLAFVNFVVGIACVALALISLSIVPDCAGSISGQVLTYFVVQCVMELAALIMTTFSVSYMLAVNDGVFINESFDDVPGYTIIICLITAACLQFFCSAYKYLEVICPSIW
uniref:Uncharacterized protein n=1 Tax=Acrobeloides nanus TaxID=290746 RepID=A0A914DRQ3_9BILA